MWLYQLFTNDSGQTLFIWWDYELGKTGDEFMIMPKIGIIVTYQKKYARLPFHEEFDDALIALVEILAWSWTLCHLRNRIGKSWFNSRSHKIVYSIVII